MLFIWHLAWSFYNKLYRIITLVLWCGVCRDTKHLQFTNSFRFELLMCGCEFYWLVIKILTMHWQHAGAMCRSSEVLAINTFKKNKTKIFKRNNNHCKRAYALILLKAACNTQNERNHFDLLPLAELYHYHKYGRIYVGRYHVRCETICV